MGPMRRAEFRDRMDVLMGRIDGHMARGNEHMAQGNEHMARSNEHMVRGNEIMARNTEVFERYMQAFERYMQVTERYLQVTDDLHAFIRDINTRVERSLAAVTGEVREGRDEQRAQTQALLRWIDRMDEGGSAASA